MKLRRYEGVNVALTPDRTTGSICGGSGFEGGSVAHAIGGGQVKVGLGCGLDRFHLAREGGGAALFGARPLRRGSPPPKRW